MKNPIHPVRFVTALLMATCVVSAAAQAPHEPADPSSQSAPETFPAPVNLRVLPRNLTGRQVHDLMKQWSSELGVRCVACHVKESDAVISGGRTASRFADDSKPTKQTARLMVTMTEAINNGYLAKMEGAGTPVTCGTCHRGRATPEPFFASSDPQVCTDCHAAIVRPHLFEHAAVKAEGCTACHVPHGSQNAHLLIRADIDGICQQCHIPSPDPETGAHMKSPASDARPCTACHVDIHGSNVSPVFLRKE